MSKFLPAFESSLKERIIFWMDSDDSSTHMKERVIKLLHDCMKQPIINLDFYADGDDDLLHVFHAQRDEINKYLGHSNLTPVFVGMGPGGYFAKKMGGCFSDSLVVLIDPVLNPGHYRDLEEEEGLWQKYFCLACVSKFEDQLRSLNDGEYLFDINCSHKTHLWASATTSYAKTLKQSYMSTRSLSYPHDSVVEIHGKLSYEDYFEYIGDFFDGIKQREYFLDICRDKEPFIDLWGEWLDESKFQLTLVNDEEYPALAQDDAEACKNYALKGANEQIIIQINFNEGYVCVCLTNKEKNDFLNNSIFFRGIGANVMEGSFYFYRHDPESISSPTLFFSIKDLYKKYIFDALTEWLNESIQSNNRLITYERTVMPGYRRDTALICKESEIDDVLSKIDKNKSQVHIDVVKK